MAYTSITAPKVLSELIGDLQSQHEQMRSFERSTIAAGPTVKPVGLIHNATDFGTGGLYTGTGEVLRRWNGSTYTLVLDLAHPQLNAGGTVKWDADQNADGNKLVGLAAATANGDAVRFEQLGDAIAGPWATDADADGKLILNLGSPLSQSSDQAAARYDDTWQSPHGLFWYTDAMSFDDGSGGGSPAMLNTVLGGKRTNPSAATSFCPRKMHILVGGTLTKFGGGTTTMAVTGYDVYRADSTSGWVTVGTVTTGGGWLLDVQVQFKTSLARGFYIRLRRQSNGDLYSAATADAWCFGGVGFSS